MFWVDCINASTILFIQEMTSEMLYLTFSFRIIQVRETYSIIDEYYQFTQRYPTAFNLLKLISQIIVVAHFIGCIFITVAKYEEIFFGTQFTWLQDQNIYNEGWSTKYVYSLYFVMITMCKVGYGDISPVTDFERIVVLITVIVGCGVYAYAINTIGSIF